MISTFQNNLNHAKWISKTNSIAIQSEVQSYISNSNLNSDFEINGPAGKLTGRPTTRLRGRESARFETRGGLHSSVSKTNRIGMG